MTISILSCVALIALVAGAIYAVVGALQARRADGPEEEGPKKLSQAQVGFCIAVGGFAVFVLSLLGVLH